MSWRIDFSRKAERFLGKNTLTPDEVRRLVGMAISYFRGENLNIDIKKLKGEWR